MSIIESYVDRYIVWVRRVFRKRLTLGYWFYMTTTMLSFVLLMMGAYLCFLTSSIVIAVLILGSIL